MQITPEALVVYDDVAAEIGPLLRRELDRARRSGRIVAADVVETIERLETMAEAYVMPERNQTVSTVDAAGFEAVEWVTVSEVAQITGRTEQAITKRCRRGQLRAERDGAGRWLVDRASIKETA